jgi:hypothetical protein
MKCKAKRCALETMHKGKCSEIGPYAVANAVANKPKADAGRPRSGEAERSARTDAASRPESQRVQKWREQNRERYNERMRRYMKSARAKKAQAVSAPQPPQTVMTADSLQSVPPPQ